MLLAGAAALVLTALWAVWCKYNESSLHIGVKFLALIGVILLGLSLLAHYEPRIQTQRFPVLTVEGPVIGTWEKTDRVRNHQDSTSQYRTGEFEGFQVGAVPFVYERGGAGN